MKNRLKHLRTLKGITLRELSEKVNISYVTLSRYENGHQQIIDENLITLSQFFDVSTDYLLGVSDIIKPSSDKLGILKEDDFQYALYNKTKDLDDKQKRDIMRVIEALINDDEED